MAARANSAALNAALNAYVKEHDYKNLNSAISNYTIPKNYNYAAARNSRRPAKGYYFKNANQTSINLEINRNIKKNLIRMGIKSAKPTKKERATALAENTRRRKAVNVIKKRYIKSTLPGAKKVRTRKVKEAVSKLNQERRLANLAVRARARANELAAARRVAVGLGAALGPRGKLTQAAKSTPASSISQPAPYNPLTQRAQPPSLNRAPALRANALEAMRATVQREVTTPKKTGGVQSRLGKTLKGLGKR
jgi:hypothetical protein